MDDLKTANRVFTVWSDELDGRLDPKFYSPISLAWNEDWKIEKLGKFITRRLEIFPADELSEENFVTLSLNGEIKPKRIMGWRRMKDTLFSSKFFKAKEGDFVFSKIDIRNGASAVIPRGREIAVTAEFPVYAVSDEILPEYLALLFRYKQVLSWLDRKSIGHSGRKRTDGKVVEALPIPVPPIEIQKEMVEKLGNAVEEKRRKEQEIRDILSSIDTFVLGELGVEVPEGGGRRKDIYSVE